MISRKIVSIYYIDRKKRPFELAIAFVGDHRELSQLAEEAKKFGRVSDSEVYRTINGSFDFGLNVHATYDPEEVATHIKNYAKDLAW